MEKLTVPELGTVSRCGNFDSVTLTGDESRDLDIIDKVNEIVEWINEQENCNNKRFYGVGEHEIHSNLLTQASNKRLGEMREQLKKPRKKTNK